MASKNTNSTYSPLQMGAYHMIGNDAWEPQRTNNFEIQIQGLDSLVSIDKGIKMPSNSGECLTLSTKSVGDLATNIDALKVSYGNNSINFAGKPSYSDIQITFNDFIGLSTERILTAWHALVYNPKTQKVGRASIYKKTAYLIEYSPDGEQRKTWQLYGCFPGTLSFGGYSNDDASIREVSVTMFIDYAIPLDA